MFPIFDHCNYEEAEQSKVPPFLIVYKHLSQCKTGELTCSVVADKRHVYHMFGCFAGDAILEGGRRPGPVHGPEQAHSYDGPGPSRGTLLPSLSRRVHAGTDRGASRWLPRATQDQGLFYLYLSLLPTLLHKVHAGTDRETSRRLPRTTQDQGLFSLFPWGQDYKKNHKLDSKQISNSPC